MKKIHARTLFGIGAFAFLTAGQGGCTEGSDGSAARVEQAQVAQQQQQIAQNQPVPVFDYSWERNQLIKIYRARQQATSTFSVVQSEYTGKVLWSCPSMGFPIPYATQLTNPHQGVIVRNRADHDGSATIELAEPNGLYSPQQSDATWVPCVTPDGKVAPVYEEKHVTVFFYPVKEVDGQLVPIPNAPASFTIDPKSR